MPEPTNDENPTPIRPLEPGGRAGVRRLQRVAEEAALKVIGQLEAIAEDEAKPSAERMAARRLLLEAAAKLDRAEYLWIGEKGTRRQVEAKDPPAQLPRGLPGR
jgi:hypothetical protein